MIDRFHGIRFEVVGAQILNIGFEKAIQDSADDLGCFGWVQESARGCLVGEARCSKSNGPKFESWLKSGYTAASIDNVEIKIYEDTKIRLHYAYFKILDKSRNTCFLDRPHMCGADAFEHVPASNADEL